MHLIKLLEIAGSSERLTKLIEDDPIISDELWIRWSKKGEDFLTNMTIYVLKKSSKLSTEEIANEVALSVESLAQAGEVLSEIEDKIFLQRAKILKYGLTSMPSECSTADLKLGNLGKKRDAPEMIQKAAQFSGDLVRRKRKATDEGLSLASKEGLIKIKAVARLKEIAVRAGLASSIMNKDLDMIGAEYAEDLRDMVLSSGAPATIKGHVAAWERMEDWLRNRCEDEMIYPLSLNALLAYYVFRKNSECGPAVLPALRGTVSWISRKIGMPIPDLKSEYLVAIENEVFEARGEEVKKAIPFPMDLVAALENMLMSFRKIPEKKPTAYFVWILLLMTYSSLRFSDMLHTKPETLVYNKGVLYGSCWRTKVERKKRGTKFAVPDVAITKKPWLTEGLKIFEEIAPEKSDFMIYHLEDWGTISNAPMEYGTFVKFMRSAILFAWHKAYPEGHPDIALDATKFTGHSARVTMIDAGSHSEESQTAQMVQANWQSADMPLEYSRQTKMIAINMVHGLVKKVRRGWRPGDTKETDSSSDEELLQERAFFVRKDLKTGSSLTLAAEVKYHLQDRKDPKILACNSHVLVSICESMGSYAPEERMICKNCYKKRADLF